MNKIFIGLVVLIIGALAGWYLLGSKGNLPSYFPTPQQTTSVSPTTGAIDKVVVTYTDNGFVPKTITTKVGTTVTFVNQSASPMWVASDVHPTHQLLPGFDELQSVGQGGSYDYTFVKVGTWTYHNHMSPSVKGTVVVTP